MSTHHATPADAQRALDGAAPGDAVVLLPGRYTEVLRMTGRGDPDRDPIVVRAEPGAVLDGGLSAEEFRKEANRKAKRHFDTTGHFPGLYPWIEEGRLVLERCRNVRLEGLEIERAWPTLLALVDCASVTIARCRFRDGTFAIAALGADTRDLVVDGCEWVQDWVPGRMWREIPWHAIHGDPTDPDDPHPVDVDEDWRLFDGDFLRAYGIRGGVTIRNCSISSAFNVIHSYNKAADPALGRDFDVHDCVFREIRDNVLEPETTAFNWWFHRNEIIDCHKWFSFECVHSGYFYLFANRGWHASLQGPRNDPNRGGGVFKLAKSVARPWGPHYVFHNSFSLRSDYARKGVFPGLEHRANAIRYSDRHDPVFDGTPARFFGDLSAPPGTTEKRFTTEWERYRIAMQDDVVRSPDWPDELRAAGYALGPGIASDPGFAAPFGGDLRLGSVSPCRGCAAALDLALPDGTSWCRSAGGDVGAWQGDRLIEGPRFRPLTVTPGSTAA